MNKISDAQFIENMHDEIISAFNSYDLEKLLGMHTEDIVVMEQNRPIISGKEEVKKIFTKAFDHVRENKILFNLSFKIHELEVWGNRAFARGQVNRITRKADGSIHEENGKYLCLFKKQDDGSWLRSHVMANDDAPSGTGAEDFLKE
jgi:ketosteroid isomerase-like protein